MKLLLDANLSWRLVKLLRNEFKEVIHVNTVSLPEPAKDYDIWNYAPKNGFTIVSNDDDFNILSQRFGFPLKVILLKTGNQGSKYISNLLKIHISDIHGFENSPDYGLLEIY